MTPPAAERPGIVTRSSGSDGGRSFKVVVTGPFSAGKTTFIRTLSGDDYLATDREVTDASRSRKSQTTVAMDFGRLTFDGDLSLQLLGTPGQQRFDVMWEILAKGMMGFILLVDPAAPEAFPEAKHILTSFRRLRDVPCVVGVSHLEGTAAEKRSALASVRKSLALPPSVPVVSCDARVKADAKKTLVKLLSEILVRSGSERAAAG